jgi:DNA-binding protein HU-beta
MLRRPRLKIFVFKNVADVSLRSRSLDNRGKKMNKAELVDAIARRAGGSKAMADSMVDAMIDTITGSLKNGENVTLVGFGTFSQGNRAARAGRNPQNGAAIKIPAAKTAKFAAGTRLKAAMNGK